MVSILGFCFFFCLKLKHTSFFFPTGILGYASQAPGAVSCRDCGPGYCGLYTAYAAGIRGRLPEVSCYRDQTAARCRRSRHERENENSNTAVVHWVPVKNLVGIVHFKHVFVFYLCRCTSLISDATGVFPEYPNEEDGGSALIFVEKNPQQVYCCSDFL